MRSRGLLVVLMACGTAWALVGCEAILGLDKYTKVDAADDAGDGAVEADAGPDGQLLDQNAPVATRWARWKMPNPADAEVDVNVAVYSQRIVTDGGVEVVQDQTPDGPKLTWSVAVGPATTLLGAQAFCESLGPGFRVPRRIELVSILDYTQQGAKIAPVFLADAGVDRLFWTSSPDLQKQDQVWVVDFGSGAVTKRSSVTGGGETRLVRCVQGGT